MIVLLQNKDNCQNMKENLEIMIQAFREIREKCKIQEKLYKEAKEK